MGSGCGKEMVYGNRKKESRLKREECMRKNYILALVHIVLISCAFGREKFTPKSIEKLFNKTEAEYFATSELEEKGYVYSAYYLVDGNTNTCWATRVNGGVGEEILIFLKWAKGVSILNGFTKSKALYEANNRVKEVEIKLYRMLYDGTSDAIDFPRMLYMTSINLLEQTNIILHDEFGVENKYYFSTDIKSAEEFVQYALVLRIKSVYRGSKYNDLCISEIRLLDDE